MPLRPIGEGGDDERHTSGAPKDDVLVGQNYQRLALVETQSRSTLPTEVVMYLADLDEDERRLARISRLIAKRFDITPNYLFGNIDPKSYRDPFTDEPLSLRQAQRFSDSFAPVAVASMISGVVAADVAGRKERKIDPNGVSRLLLVLSRSFGDDLAFDQGVALAAQLAKDGVGPARLARNIEVVRDWALAYGTSDTQTVLGHAISQSMLGVTLTDVRELQVKLFSTDVVEARELEEKLSEQLGTDAIITDDTPLLSGTIGLPRPATGEGALFQAELGPAYWDEVEAIQTQLRADAEAFETSWFGQRLNTLGGFFNGLWNVTQKGLVSGGTGIVGTTAATMAAMGLDPQGETALDNVKAMQRMHAYLWRRIEEGDTVGDFFEEGIGKNPIYAFEAPEWSGTAFDFLASWVADPFVVAGAAAKAMRSGRVLPGTLQKVTIPGLVANKLPGLKIQLRGGIEFTVVKRFDEIAERQAAAWAKAIPAFARSGTSRRLFNDAMAGGNVTRYFRRIERLRGTYEARGTLDLAYMKALRDKVRQRFGDGGNEAWEAWQQGIVAHFVGSAPAGTVAAEVVAARAALGFRAEQLADDFIHQPKLFEETVSGYRYDGPSGGYVRLADETGAGANELAYIPPLSVELPGRSFFGEYGPRRLLRTAVTSPLATRNLFLARRSSRIISINPGRRLAVHDRAAEYVMLHARRWGNYDEDSVRLFQSKAVEIINSGRGIEKRLGKLIDEMDTLGLDTYLAPYNLSDDFRKQIHADVFNRTRTLNTREQAFMVRRGGQVVDTPLLETQLANFLHVTDPIQVQQYVRRVISARTRASRLLRQNLEPLGIASDDAVHRAFVAIMDRSRDWHRGYRKAWRAYTVARPAYVIRVIGIDENARFLATAGSLTERLISLALTRQGKANFLSRKLDDWFDEVIQVGDTPVRIPRPGAYDYEPLAVARIRENELIEEVMRGATLYNKTLAVGGKWGKIAPGETQHLNFWGHALHNQLRRSEPGRLALESVKAGDTIDATERALVAWARTDNFTTLRSRIGIDPTDVELWATDVAGFAHGYTLGDKTIAQVVLDGDRKALHRVLQGTKTADRPPVHGAQLETLLDGNAVTRVTDHLYEWFVRLPEDALNRQPYYKTWKARYEKGAYRALRDTPLAPTAQAEVRALGFASLDDAVRTTASGAVPLNSTDEVAEALRKELPFSSADNEHQRFGNALDPVAQQVYGQDVVYRGMSLDEFARAQAEGFFRAGGVQKARQGETFFAHEMSGAAGYVNRSYGQAFGKRPGFGSSEERVVVVFRKPESLSDNFGRGPSTTEAVPLEIVVGAYRVKVRALDEQGMIAETRSSLDIGDDVADEDVLAVGGREITMAEAESPRSGAYTAWQDSDLGMVEWAEGLPRAQMEQVARRSASYSGASYDVTPVTSLSKTNPLAGQVASLSSKARQELATFSAIRDAISNASRDFALGQVRRVMFDFTRQSRFTELLQTFFPFPQPFFEGFQAWGHIAWRNPEAIGRGRALWQLGLDSGFIRKDPQSGEYVIPLSAYRPVALLVNALFGGDRKMLDRMDWSTPITSLNMLTSTTLTLPGGGIIGRIAGGVPIPVPGMDPVLVQGLQKVFANSRSQWLSGWLFQFGSQSPMRLVPPILQAPIRAAFPALFHDSQHASMMLTVTAAMHVMGLDVDDDGKPLPPQELDRLAAAYADDLLLVRAVTSLFTPASARLVDREQAADQELFDTYLTAAGDDFFAATQAFLADHPEKYFVVAGRTQMEGGYSEGQKAPRINPSDLVRQLYATEGIGEFMRTNPQWAALMLIGTDPTLAEQRDFSVFAQFIASGVMRYRGPNEYLTAAQAQPAQQEVTRFYQEVWNPGLARLGERGLDESDHAYLQLKQMRSEFYEGLAARFPAWGALNITRDTAPDGTTEYVRAYGVNGKQALVDDIRQDAWAIVNTPGISDMPGPLALRTYLEGTEAIREEMTRKRLTDINDDRAADLFKRYQAVVTDTLAEAPDIRPFLVNYFGVGLSEAGKVTYTDDLVYSIGEADWNYADLGPGLQRDVTRLDNRIEDLRQQTVTGFETEAQRSRAYLQLATQMDKMLAEHPKVLEGWWKGQGHYYREQYREGLVGKPLVFYSRWDFHLMGLDTTSKAAGWLAEIADARVRIAQAEEADPVGYSESDGFKAINTYVRGHLGEDASFDAVVKATNRWGWALEQAGYPELPGKAGWAWRNLLETARGLQEQVNRYELQGEDFGTDDERRVYALAAKALAERAKEYREWSPAFTESWDALKAATGEPIIGGSGLFMPDSYFGPLGVHDYG